MQKSEWHKPDEKPRIDRRLLLCVKTEDGIGVVVGYYDEYEKTFGWNDFINFVNYDLDPSMVKVLAWKYLPEPPSWIDRKS